MCQFDGQMVPGSAKYKTSQGMETYQKQMTGFTRIQAGANKGHGDRAVPLNDKRARLSDHLKLCKFLPSIANALWEVAKLERSLCSLGAFTPDICTGPVCAPYCALQFHASCHGNVPSGVVNSFVCSAD